MRIIPSLNGTCFATPVDKMVPRRPGTKFVCNVAGPVDRLEAFERGAWCFIRVHYKDGTAEDIGLDGKPVVIRGA